MSNAFTPRARSRSPLAARLAFAAALSFPGFASAQSDTDVAQAIGRAEAAIQLVTSVPNASITPASAQIAGERLNEARAALDAKDRPAALWRAQEAELEAAVAIAEIRRAAAERRAQELADAVSALEQEAQR